MHVLTEHFRQNKFWVKKQIIILEHPVYVTNLDPCIFFYVPKIFLKGSHFDSLENIQFMLTYQKLMTVIESTFRK
jgi:hypothetical protein